MTFLSSSFFAHTQFSYTENSINILFTAIHSILFDSFYRQELNTSEQFRHTYRNISLFCTRTSEWFFWLLVYTLRMFWMVKNWFFFLRFVECAIFLGRVRFIFDTLHLLKWRGIDVWIQASGITIPHRNVHRTVKWNVFVWTLKNVCIGKIVCIPILFGTSIFFIFQRFSIFTDIEADFFFQQEFFMFFLYLSNESSTTEIGTFIWQLNVLLRLSILLHASRSFFHLTDDVNNYTHL